MRLTEKQIQDIEANLAKNRIVEIKAEKNGSEIVIVSVATNREVISRTKAQ